MLGRIGGFLRQGHRLDDPSGYQAVGRMRSRSAIGLPYRVDP